MKWSQTAEFPEADEYEHTEKQDCARNSVKQHSHKNGHSDESHDNSLLQIAQFGEDVTHSEYS
jgi:hypothetical protein